MMIKIPAHKQTDKSKAPGQIIYPKQPEKSDKGDRTLADYIKNIKNRENL